MGLGVGIFPVFGTTTILCAVLAGVFRLNQPVVQVANYLAYPLQISLFIPFLRMGDRWFRLPPGALSLPAFLASMRMEPWHAVAGLWTRIWHACLVWAVIVIPVTVGLALGLRPILEAASRRYQGR